MPCVAKNPLPGGSVPTLSPLTGGTNSTLNIHFPLFAAAKVISGDHPYWGMSGHIAMELKTICACALCAVCYKRKSTLLPLTFHSRKGGRFPSRLELPLGDPDDARRPRSPLFGGEPSLFALLPEIGCDCADLCDMKELCDQYFSRAAAACFPSPK
jgi:hypothetical protein